MVQILQSAFTEALGWSLVDSLWQTGALWGLYCVVTLNGSSYNASLRHNLAFGTLSLSTVLFFATLFFNYRSIIQDNRPYSFSYFIYQPFEKSWNYLVYPDSVASFISSAYLVIVLFNCFKLIYQYSSGSSLKKDLLPANEAITNHVYWLSKKMETGKKVSVWLSKKIISPLTTGVVKPMILLPAELITQLDASQLEALIVHELHHIRRNDYLLNLLLVFSETIMFFNPFALMLSSIVRNERENSCDDKVLQMGYDAWNYSDALYTISSQNKRTMNILLLAAAGSHKKVMLARIKRMMKLSQPSPSFIKPAAAFFLCLSIAFFAVRGTSDKSSVETASNSVEIESTSLLLYRPEPIILETVVIKKKKEVVVDDKKTASSGKQPSMPAADRDLLKKEKVLVDEYFTVPIFINKEREIEFTIIIPEVPEIPQPVARETPLPYVPGSTFYFPVDSLDIQGESGEPIRI